MGQLRKGKADIHTLCCIMVFQSPVKQKSYVKSVDQILRATGQSMECCAFFFISEEIRRLKYKKYIGDGDAKTFNVLLEAKR